MQLREPNKVTGVIELVLAASIVVAGAIITVPEADSQQDVDPTWYDYPAVSSKTATQPAPPTKGQPKQHMSGSPTRHHTSNKTRAKKQASGDSQHVANASVR